MHVKHSSPRRLASQMLLYHQVKGTENVALEIEHGWESKTDIRETKLFGGEVPQHMITIASANVLPKNSLEKAAKYLALSKLNVVRAHLDVIEDPGHGTSFCNSRLNLYRNEYWYICDYFEYAEYFELDYLNILNM